ncbi:MAG: hypothetical protein BGO29_08070 [Bacteroidales bacterium 36-12]|nr:MAG: hypothetical protein BGO29_08070 [Bacteroidales bacterium 36-12]
MIMTETPNNIGLLEFKNIPLSDIVPFIHWSFFFMAWRMTGKYEGIETATDCESCKASWLNTFLPEDRERAEEALKLYKDAQEILREFRDKNVLTINASLGIYPAYSDGDDIIIQNDGKDYVIPTLRQQKPAHDGFCYSLADFINPAGDYVGVFANTVLGAEAFAETYEKKDDIYTAFIIKILAERIAEGTAEWMHYHVRTKYWGYSPTEKEDHVGMLKEQYRGIRPAVGYPSLPDQSVIFELDPLIKFNNIGIKLTESGAMDPNASVCGMYFAHPQSRYFMVGKIDEEQFLDYAKRRNKSPEVLRKWLASNL